MKVNRGSLGEIPETSAKFELRVLKKRMDHRASRKYVAGNQNHLEETVL